MLRDKVLGGALRLLLLGIDGKDNADGSSEEFGAEKVSRRETSKLSLVGDKGVEYGEPGTQLLSSAAGGGLICCLLACAVGGRRIADDICANVVRLGPAWSRDDMVAVGLAVVRGWRLWSMAQTAALLAKTAEG